MSGFDRIRDPREGDGPGAGSRARRALFSTPVSGPHLRCTRCGAPSRLGPVTLTRIGVTGFVVLPWRSAPLRARCPVCRHRVGLELRLR